MLVTIAWFTIGAIVAGVADNFTQMLIGRSLQGIGGGGIITLTAILIADIVPLSERPKFFGMLSGIWSLGTVVGPVIGGCFAEKATWVRLNLFDLLTRVLLTVILSAGSSMSTSRSLESEQSCLLVQAVS